ncbi:MAG: hypothetical protein KUL79_10045, partial [Thauera sp.]|nr:hypothetical protein [Thauera sp.]
KTKNPAGCKRGLGALALAVFVERPQAVDQIGARWLEVSAREGKSQTAGMIRFSAPAQPRMP